MPEGPEVQVVVNDLKDLGLIGKRIKSTVVYPQIPTDLKWRNFRGFVLQNPERLKLLELEDNIIIDIKRIAKFVHFKLANGYNILIHLSFTGCFKVTKSEEELKPTDYPAITFIFDNLYLTFCTKRGLSKIWILNDKELNEKDSIKFVKVDGLNDTVRTIHKKIEYDSRVRLSKEEVKPYLLNYKNIAGIGNIYGSEICYYTKINPTKKVKDLTDDEIVKLALGVKHVLGDALEHRGSSVEDFNSLGKEGTHQNYLKVYGKKICECGAEIKVIKQKGRSTYYCTKEQELIKNNVI